MSDQKDGEVNGCGPEGTPEVITDVLSGPFEGACNAHDRDFASGSGVSLSESERRFEKNLAQAAGRNPFLWLWGAVIYVPVRVFGRYFYRGDKEKGET